MFWELLVTFALIKLLVASLMLWLPFRHDAAMNAIEDPPRPEPGADDGGSKVFSARPESDPHPRRPLPRLPRRGGPHGAPASAPAARVRGAGRAMQSRGRRARVAR